MRKLRAHWAFIPLVACTLATVGGCGSKAPAPKKGAASETGGPWFCQTNVTFDGWDCELNASSIPSPRPLPNATAESDLEP